MTTPSTAITAEPRMTSVSRLNRPRPLLMIPLRRCGSHALRLRLNFSTAAFIIRDRAIAA